MKLPRLKHTKNKAQIDSEITSIDCYLMYASHDSLLSKLTLSAITDRTFSASSLNINSGSLNYASSGCFMRSFKNSFNPIGHFYGLFPRSFVEFH